jgi:hypothetical protein
MSKNKEASLKQWSNFFFNPFASGEGDIPTTSRDTPTSTSVKHAAGLAVGYGGIGMLLRYLKKMKDEADVTTTDSKMRDYIEAKNPILSLDPSIRDTKTEQKEKVIGVQRTENDPTFMGKEGSSSNALSQAAALAKLKEKNPAFYGRYINFLLDGGYDDPDTALRDMEDGVDFYEDSSKDITPEKDKPTSGYTPSHR